MLKKNKVTIYTAWYCSFCDDAKKILDNNKIDYTEIPTSKNNETWQEMVKLSDKNTAPQIFINNKAIGGFDNLSLLNNNGELNKLLK